MIMTLDEQFQSLGVGIEHFFSDREYAKKTDIPAGVVLTQHNHSYSHLSILATGNAMVTVDGESKEYTGPACLVIDAGKEHSVTALTDVCWVCVHSTDCKDPEAVDATLIERSL